MIGGLSASDPATVVSLRLRSCVSAPRFTFPFTESLAEAL